MESVFRKIFGHDFFSIQCCLYSQKIRTFPNQKSVEKYCWMISGSKWSKKPGNPDVLLKRNFFVFLIEKQIAHGYESVWIMMIFSLEMEKKIVFLIEKSSFFVQFHIKFPCAVCFSIKNTKKLCFNKTSGFLRFFGLFRPRNHSAVLFNPSVTK